MPRIRQRQLEQETPGSKPRERQTRTPVRELLFKVHAGDGTHADAEKFSRFVENINAQFSRVSDEIVKIPKVDSGQFIRKEDLGDILDQRDADILKSLTSEGETDGSTTRKRKRTSRGRGISDDAGGAGTTIVNNSASSLARAAVFAAPHSSTNIPIPTVTRAVVVATHVQSDNAPESTFRRQFLLSARSIP
jgi:hypothetical protein